MAALDLATFDPDTLDFAALASADALVLVERLQQRGSHAHALRVVEGEIADVARDAAANGALLALLYWHSAEAQRLLRRFEDASEALAESERRLATLSAALDADEVADRALLAWSETLRCSQIGLRGWIQQDWGALDAALASFERERAEIERLAARGIDVARIRADSRRHLAVFAALTGAPGRIRALLAELPERGVGVEGERAFLLLRLASACWERARRDGTPPVEARATLVGALADAALAPADRVLGQLWLADLTLDEGRPGAARELWNSAGALLEQLGAHGARPRRTWMGIGARLARAGSAGERESARALLVREIDAFLGEWRALDARESGYGLLHLDDSLRLFCELTELSLALDGDAAGARAAFEVLNRAHAETTLARRLGAGVPSLDELRQALCPRESDGVLVYLAGPTRSWLFVLDRHTLRVLPLADLYAVERPRRSLVQELLAHEGRWSATGRERARELAALLLPEEVRAWLETRSSLAVCGLDLFLGEVPFEALDLGAGRRVGAEWAICNLPPLAASVEMARRAAASAPMTPGLRVLAAPTVAHGVAAELGLAAFALAPDDLEALGRHFPRGRTDVLVGADAHAGALAGPTCAVLQFLVHGSFDATRSRGAELVLAPSGPDDDGLLSAGDVERLFATHVPARLVVLTSCRAGRGEQRRGDAGANDLAGAFLGCGAEAVVASSFDLELALACRTSAELYRALAHGRDVAEALREARAELAREPAFAASAQPFLMRVVGLPAGLGAPWSVADARGSSRVRLAAWAGGAVALGLFAGWVARRARRAP